MKCPPEVNPAEFEAAMRPEAGHPWEPAPHARGYWLCSEFGFLGPFDLDIDASDKAREIDYVTDWRVFRITEYYESLFPESPF